MGIAAGVISRLLDAPCREFYMYIQRVQFRLIEDHTLCAVKRPKKKEGIFLNQGVVGSLGTPSPKLETIELGYSEPYTLNPKS